MIRWKNSETIILECHPFIWWLHTILFLGAVVIGVAFPLVLNAPIPIFFMFICFSILGLYGLISFPRRIVIDRSSVSIIWPWRIWTTPIDQIVKIKTKKYRYKSAFITIGRRGAFLNMPIMLDWTLKSEEYEKVLEETVKQINEQISQKTRLGIGDVH